MEKQILTSEDISKIVNGFAPIDWVQLTLLANMPIEKRLIPILHAQEFAMAALRGTFRNKFPRLSMSEINMKVLAYLTPVRMEKK
jgi:predicted lipase